MKILFLSQGYSTKDQISFHAAWCRIAGSESNMLNMPVRRFVAERGWLGFYKEVVETCKSFQPDLVFFQFFHSDPNAPSPVPYINEIRRLAHSPLVFGSSGDLFQNDFWHLWSRKIPQSLVDLASVADAFFTTHMGAYAEYLVENGAKNVIFLPHGFLNENFPGWSGQRPEKLGHEIVMVGSVGFGVRHPISSSWHSFNRWRTVNALWRRYGKRFSLFGKGWHHPAYCGSIPFNEQNQLYKSSLIAIDSRAPYNEVYYASDRPFLIAGSGAVLVQFYTPRFEKIFRDGEHVHFVRNPRDLLQQCDCVLALGETELRRQGENVAKYIQLRHTIKHRVDTMLSVYEALRNHRSGDFSEGDAIRHLRLWHFLPEVDLDEERQYCILNWKG